MTEFFKQVNKYSFIYVNEDTNNGEIYFGFRHSIFTDYGLDSIGIVYPGSTKIQRIDKPDPLSDSQDTVEINITM